MSETTTNAPAAKVPASKGADAGATSGSAPEAAVAAQAATAAATSVPAAATAGAALPSLAELTARGKAADASGASTVRPERSEFALDPARVDLVLSVTRPGVLRERVSIRGGTHGGGMVLDSIAYEGEGDGWLSVRFNDPRGPTAVICEVATEGLQPGDYSATVPVRRRRTDTLPEDTRLLVVALTITGDRPGTPPPPPDPVQPDATAGGLLGAFGAVGSLSAAEAGTRTEGRAGGASPREQQEAAYVLRQGLARAQAGHHVQRLMEQVVEDPERLTYLSPADQATVASHWRFLVPSVAAYLEGHPEVLDRYGRATGNLSAARRLVADWRARHPRTPGTA